MDLTSATCALRGLQSAIARLSGGLYSLGFPLTCVPASLRSRFPPNMMLLPLIDEKLMHCCNRGGVARSNADLAAAGERSETVLDSRPPRSHGHGARDAIGVNEAGYA